MREVWFESAGESRRQRRIRPTSYDDVITITDVQALITSPSTSRYPLNATSGAAEDLRAALADLKGYEWPKITTITCEGGWCLTERLAMWVVVVKRNGVREAQLRCLVCCTKSRSIGADKVGAKWPVMRDYSNEAECARCGSTEGTERHHWAPRHLFDDADRWPMSDLCRSCHMRWHSIVTPNMHQRRAS